MKSWKTYLSLVLALVMCMALTACGGDSGNGDDEFGAPESFEGMVKDSQLLTDYAMYWGTWTGEDNSELIVEMNDSGDEVRYALYDDNTDLTASGYIQAVPEYSADYFYNEHDGVAHHSWFDDDGVLHIDFFGVFTKVSGDVPGENVGFADIAGEWYWNGQLDTSSYIEIDEDGEWELYELDADADFVLVDYGYLERDTEDEDQYYAHSNEFEGVTYDMYTTNEKTLFAWGGEGDTYAQLSDGQ
ncbi:hypothetical protein H8711_03410 [Clostridiaceae bacterium NSJ-31]|uniref:Lipoprotein n=3 Tax=Ligaoa zhengdingensis TaxID=2763658 RepID=A0A926DY58_9FIRM|nr:hypothetical protein [Ligaoa zhengdingensis]MBC8545982.1 hypothetical protein [Ligaoa zhengdingensis]